MVVGGWEAEGAAEGALLGAGAGARRFAETQDPKSLLRAAFRSWFHLPNDLCALKADELLEGSSTAFVPCAQANSTTPVPLRTYSDSSLAIHDVQRLQSAFNLQ